MSEHEVWNELGNLYFLSGARDQAIQAYNKAIQLEGNFGKAYSNLAFVYAEQEKYEQAVSLYKKSLELLTDDAQKATTWNGLGNVYRSLKQYQEAIFAYRSADALQTVVPQNDDPAVPPSLNAINTEVTAGKEIEEPQEDQCNLLGDEPPFSKPQVENMEEVQSETISKFHILLGNPPITAEINIPEKQEAQICAVETSEELATTPVLLEGVVKSEEDGQETVSESGEPIAQAQEEDTGLFDDSGLENPQTEPLPIRAEVETGSEFVSPVTPAKVDGFDTEKWMDSSPASGALTEWEPLLAVNGNPVEGEIEVNIEEEKLAKQVEINPRSATTWESLGTLYKTAGRYTEAVHAFEKAISIEPRVVSYYHNLGLVYAAQGNGQKAFDTFQKVLELDPNHSLTHASLGGYYKKMGLDELAEKHIGKAMKQIYESENEYNRACLDAICGNIDRAIDLLRIALKNEQTYVDWVINDPDLDPLRKDERFKQLISDFSK